MNEVWLNVPPFLKLLFPKLCTWDKSKLSSKRQARFEQWQSISRNKFIECVLADQIDYLDIRLFNDGLSSAWDSYLLMSGGEFLGIWKLYRSTHFSVEKGFFCVQPCIGRVGVKTKASLEKVWRRSFLTSYIYIKILLVFK